MAAHVSKRQSDGRNGPDTTGRSAAAGTGTGLATDPSPTGARADGPEPGGGHDQGEAAEQVVQVDGPLAGQGSGSRLGDSLTAPFSRYGQLTVTTVSVLVLAFMIYLAVNGMLVTR